MNFTSFWINVRHLRLIETLLSKYRLAFNGSPVVIGGEALVWLEGESEEYDRFHSELHALTGEEAK